MLGNIITISGIDGSGKSTCALMIKDLLMSIGRKAVIVDAMKHGVFITGLKNAKAEKNTDCLRGSFSANILNLAWVSDLIYIYESCVKNYLSDGYDVILHRSELCCRVYSRVFSPQSNMIDNILNDYVFNYDMSFYIDISAELAYKRILERLRNENISEKESIIKLQDALNLYLGYMQLPRYKNIHRINGLLELSMLYEVLKEQVLIQLNHTHKEISRYMYV